MLILILYFINKSLNRIHVVSTLILTIENALDTLLLLVIINSIHNAVIN